MFSLPVHHTAALFAQRTPLHFKVTTDVLNRQSDQTRLQMAEPGTWPAVVHETRGPPAVLITVLTLVFLVLIRKAEVFVTEKKVCCWNEISIIVNPSLSSCQTNCCLFINVLFCLTQTSRILLSIILPISWTLNYFFWLLQIMRALYLHWSGPRMWNIQYSVII